MVFEKSPYHNNYIKIVEIIEEFFYSIYMTIFQSIILGLIQGLAEFLPISSSGHLTVAQKLFNLEEIPILFDVILHLATLLAVVLVFRKTIIRLFCVLGRFLTRKTTEEDTNDLFMIVAILIGTAVTAVFGLMLNKIIPDLPVQAVFIGFIITALLLIFSSLYSRKKQGTLDAVTSAPGVATSVSSAGTTSDTVASENVTGINTVKAGTKKISPLQAVIVGFAQGIGVMPGISRSGSTIASSLFCNIDRETAGTFSFLLSIPAILGAFILELKDLDQLSSTVAPLPLIAGCLAAFLSGLFALKVLLKLIKKGRLEYFAFYLIPLAVLCSIFIV